jgi:branched-chain amino acid transport system substrate-binding protein
MRRPSGRGELAGRAGAATGALTIHLFTAWRMHLIMCRSGITLAMFLICLCPWVLGPECRAEQPVPIRIGATVSLEGKYSEPSLMIRDGYKLWEKQVNEAGGILGRPVELLLYDDRSSEQLAGFLYEKLITEDKVDLVLSPYGTPLTLAAGEVANRHGFMMLACGASGEEIWSRGFKTVFGVYGPATRYFIGLLDIMASNDLHSLAIVYEDSTFNRDVAAGAREWAKRFGLEVSLFKSYGSGKEQFPALLKEVEQTKPDGFILSSYPEDSYVLLDLMKAGGYRPKVLAFAVAAVYPDFYKRAGSIAEGAFGASQWEPDERIPFPGTKKFIDDFLSFTKRLPAYHAGSAYAGCQLLERAVRHCQCLVNTKLAEYIRSLDTVTVIGRFKVDHDGRQTGHNSIIIQWQDGKKEIVSPPSMQTAPPRF